MSRVRSDKFTNRAATGPCTFTDGLCATDTTGVAIGVTLGYGGIVAVGATFGGDVSIGGTLTYEDVQNVDSTGLITARSGIKVGSPTGVGATFNPVGDLDIAGIVTAASGTFTTGTVTNAVITNLDTSGTLVEAFSSTTTAWSTTNDLNITNGNLQFCSANLAGTNNTLDIISTTGINTDLAVGQALNVTAITAVNATTAYVNAITIDGQAVTESWVGGSAPTDGGDSGYDTYSFNILKTGSETFICIANQVKTS